MQLHNRLSSHLAEQTGNTTYLDAAKLSANFVYNNLYNVNSLVERNLTLGVTGASARSCQVNKSAKRKIPSASGEYMEALSVLSALDNDPRWPLT
jgi:hypothetical protein